MTKDILSENKKRYHLIDSIRGFAVINMVLFHLMYDIYMIYFTNNWASQPLVILWERFICFTFILISGMSFNFSRNTWKNGIMVSLMGFVVTAVTVIAMPSQAIWFGILNLLGCSMLIASPLKVYTEKIPPLVGAAVSLLLFAITYGIPRHFIGFFSIRLVELPQSLYQCKYLAFLGFPSPDFRSTDFFPLLPWVFLFFAGVFIWKLIEKHHAEKYFEKKIPVLNVIGKYSLWIYLAHQPVIMLVLYVTLMIFIFNG